MVELKLPITAELKSSKPLTKAMIKEMKNNRAARCLNNEKRRLERAAEGFIGRLRAKIINTAIVYS
jgi:hypothetical protein